MMARFSILLATGVGLMVAASAAWAAPSPMRPGQWDIAVTIDDVQTPGSAAGVAAMMRGRTSHIGHCYTAAEAAKGSDAMITGQTTCVRSKSVMEGGRIAGEMTCQHGRTTSHVTQEGAYTATGFRIRSHVVESGGPMAMTMTTSTIGTRTGDCGG